MNLQTHELFRNALVSAYMPHMHAYTAWTNDADTKKPDNTSIRNWGSTRVSRADRIIETGLGTSPHEDRSLKADQQGSSGE